MLAGCAGGGGGGTSSTTSATGGATTSGSPSTPAPGLRVLVTDAPFPFNDVKSANVTITRIDIAEVGGGFTTLKDYGAAGVTFDLLQLRNGAVLELVALDPPAGSYDRIRLVVDHADVELTRNGANRPTQFNDLKVPSGDQTGIKLNIDPPIQVVTALSAELILDFDLSRSFVFNGNIDRGGVRSVIFKPVIRAVNASTAGRVTGTVLSDDATPGDTSDDDLLDGATVRLSQAGTLVASGSTAIDGTFAVIAVPAGAYDVEVEAFGHGPWTGTATVVVANATSIGAITLVASQAQFEGTVSTRVPAATTTSSDYVGPLEGALVTATEPGAASPTASDVSDPSGNYIVTVVPIAGQHDLEASAVGYATATAQARASFSGKVVDFELLADPQVATGSVADATATPVNGATVVATLAGSGEVYGTATTDATGAFTIPGLYSGSWSFEATAGTVTVTQTADLPAASVSITLP